MLANSRIMQFCHFLVIASLIRFFIPYNSNLTNLNCKNKHLAQVFDPCTVLVSNTYRHIMANYQYRQF